MCKSSSSKAFDLKRNDENDSHRAGNSQSEDAFDVKDDEEEVLKPKPSATNDDNQAGHIQDADDIKVDFHSKHNQLDEHSIDIQIQPGYNNINENIMHSNPASPSLFYASSTASTPIRDNRAPERVSNKMAKLKRKKLAHLSNSSSDEDDFAIMRAKLAKKKQFQG